MRVCLRAHNTRTSLLTYLCILLLHAVFKRNACLAPEARGAACQIVECDMCYAPASALPKACLKAWVGLALAEMTLTRGIRAVKPLTTCVSTHIICTHTCCCAQRSPGPMGAPSPTSRGNGAPMAERNGLPVRGLFPRKGIVGRWSSVRMQSCSFKYCATVGLICCCDHDRHSPIFYLLARTAGPAEVFSSIVGCNSFGNGV